MGTLSQWFQFKGTIAEGVEGELAEIFPLGFERELFIDIDCQMIFQKILTDVLERTHGLNEDEAALLWDNCVSSSSHDGLISILAKAMLKKKELFLVYEKSVGVVREARADESSKIKESYAKVAEKVQLEKGIGIFVSFKNYQKADMVKLYAGLEYDTIASLYKQMNLSKAIQLKLNDLRSSTGASDSSEAIAQAKLIAAALRKGKDILLDKNDTIETSRVDLSATKEAISFLDSKRSFYLGLPAAYINGEQTGGLGTTGENDTKAIERGLKSYFFAIIKPACEELFDTKLKYKSQDFRQITQALEAMKTFDLVSEEYISHEQKKKIIESLLDIDEADNLTTPPVEVPPIPVTS